jgi:hypothetical protein
MQRHECNKHNYLFINNYLKFYFLIKIIVLHLGEEPHTKKSARVPNVEEP